MNDIDTIVRETIAAVMGRSVDEIDARQQLRMDIGASDIDIREIESALVTDLNLRVGGALKQNQATVGSVIKACIALAEKNATAAPKEES